MKWAPSLSQRVTKVYYFNSYGRSSNINYSIQKRISSFMAIDKSSIYSYTYVYIDDKNIKMDYLVNLKKQNTKVGYEKI
jgi:hypothetical protein